MKSRIEELIEIDAKAKANDVMSHVSTIVRASILTVLDEIEESNNPKAAIAEIRKRLSV